MLDNMKIIVKNSHFETVCMDDSGYTTQLNQQKSKMMILRSIVNGLRSSITSGLVDLLT